MHTFANLYGHWSVVGVNHFASVALLQTVNTALPNSDLQENSLRNFKSRFWLNSKKKFF